MSEHRDCHMIGRWRIVEAYLWDTEHLDPVQPAMLVIAGDGHGEVVFGAFQAGLRVSCAKTVAFFTWPGFDEMDEVTGEGSA